MYTQQKQGPNEREILDRTESSIGLLEKNYLRGFVREG